MKNSERITKFLSKHLRDDNSIGVLCTIRKADGTRYNTVEFRDINEARAHYVGMVLRKDPVTDYTTLELSALISDKGEITTMYDTLLSARDIAKQAQEENLFEAYQEELQNIRKEDSENADI